MLEIIVFITGRFGELFVNILETDQFNGSVFLQSITSDAQGIDNLFKYGTAAEGWRKGNTGHNTGKQDQPFRSAFPPVHKISGPAG